jgi:serine/threonine-protein kinase SRPK3
MGVVYKWRFIYARSHIDAGFTYSADMWSLGVLVQPLLLGDSMTNCVDTVMGFAWGKETIWSSGPSQNHLVQISALLGLAPKGLLQLGRRTSLFYDSGESLALKRIATLYWSLTWFSGNIKYLELVPKEFNFENTLKWKPDERSTAKELLSDPRLYTDFED